MTTSAAAKHVGLSRGSIQALRDGKKFPTWRTYMTLRCYIPTVPCGQLADGAWVFAPVGAMLVVEGGRRVVCHACGEALTAVSRGPLDRHGLDLAGYRARFGLNRKASLLAPALAAARRAEGARRCATSASGPGVANSPTRFHPTRRAVAVRVIGLGLSPLNRLVASCEPESGVGMAPLSSGACREHQVLRIRLCDHGCRRARVLGRVLPLRTGPVRGLSAHDVFMMRGMMGGGTRGGHDDRSSSWGKREEYPPNGPSDVDGTHERLDRR